MKRIKNYKQKINNITENVNIKIEIKKHEVNFFEKHIDMCSNLNFA